ncbi:hypothetical protein [Rhizobium rhizogenes]|uniref:hypothetical protein n=1 Tax=Rhizobium rhizogenes TaxID=359 RepID=UPI0022C73EBC|nr:hypothetical protein [Rhizobium rhizogenes]MCZ7488213.1 hypothetical protein [Rhizobium rhizogenes]
MDTETALIVIVLFQSGVIAVMIALVLLTAWYRGIAIGALIRRVRNMENYCDDKLYRALGMVVSLSGKRTQDSITEDSRLWSGLIKNFSELSDDDLSMIHDAAFGRENPTGNVTSRAE